MPAQTSGAFVPPLAASRVAVGVVGGRRSLAKLAAASLPVPPWFLLTTAAYRCFVGANTLQTTIVETAAGATAGDLGAGAAAVPLALTRLTNSDPATVADALRAELAEQWEATLRRPRSDEPQAGGV